jgi:hypothetical protein
VQYCLDKGATSIYQAVNYAAKRGRIEVIEYLVNVEKYSPELIWNNVLLEVIKLKHNQRIKNIIELSIKRCNLSMESLRKAVLTAIFYNKLENLSILQQHFNVD